MSASHKSSNKNEEYREDTRAHKRKSKKKIQKERERERLSGNVATWQPMPLLLLPSSFFLFLFSFSLHWVERRAVGVRWLSTRQSDAPSGGYHRHVQVNQSSRAMRRLRLRAPPTAHSNPSRHLQCPRWIVVAVVSPLLNKRREEALSHPAQTLPHPHLPFLPPPPFPVAIN